MSSLQDFVDHIYFINLDHRTDRQEAFLHEMHSAFIPEEMITRISAIHIPDLGILGCAKSHALALRMFLASPYETCIIFEDDFSIRDFNEFQSFFSKMCANPSIQWDLLMFSGVISKQESTPYPFLHRVFDLQTTSSYCLKKSFAPILLKNIEEGAEGLEYVFKGTGRIEHSLCIDIYWKELQKQYKCFVSEPLLGFQRPSFSDIQGREVDYVNLELKEP